MKKIYTIGLLFLSSSLLSQNIGVNGSGALAHPSAAFDVSDVDQGFLLPRVTDTNVVNSAAVGGGYNIAEGLMIYDLSDRCLRIHDGNAWSTCIYGTNSKYPQGYVGCGQLVGITDVTSSTGAVWMDRNLGAYHIATSTTDQYGYGSLYQWGRFSDGHQCRNTLNYVVNATSDEPNHNMFIFEGSVPYDWRIPQNDNLWQGIYGTNNPCPIGFRIPTEAEWNSERTIDFTSNDDAGAFGGALKLPLAGQRTYSTAVINLEGSFGYYWASSVNSTNARALSFYSGNALLISAYRAYGFSVRCIKN